jgi:hypothetical protein
MKLSLLLAVVVLAVPCAANAWPPLTITDQNSSLTYTTDEPGANLGQPNDPVQLPRNLDWTVDGRHILVYPSGPSTFLDIGHLHSSLHVQANQMHAQGPMIGYGSNAVAGDVVGGVVYTVNGATAGSGASRITEKVDIHNKTGSALSVSLAGFGFKPTQAALAVPELSGLDLTGTTVVYFQGNATTNSFTEPPFAPVTVLPVVNFSGFNPLFNQTLSLPAGARLIMITELKVAPAPLILTTTILWVLLAIVLGGAAAYAAARTYGRQK